MVAPLGSAVRWLWPPQTASLAFAGATENKIEVVRGHRMHVGLLIQNAGPRLESQIRLVAPTDSGIAATLTVSELALEPSALAVAGISWRADSSVELGSYLLGVHLIVAGEIVAARSVEMVVTDTLRAPKPKAP
jgi:hypothetical protein